MDRAFFARKIKSKARTHAARGEGARLAEFNGAPEAQIKRLGRWNPSALDGCYLKNLPREAMRVMAAFPRERGQYYLRRSCTIAPESLQRQVNPWLDDALAYQESLENLANIATIGFLKLLKLLGGTVLQDSVLLRERYSDHPLWRFVVFDT